VGKGVAVPQVALLLQNDPNPRMKYLLERFTLGPTPRWFTLRLSLKTTVNSESAPDNLYILEKSDIKTHFKVISIQFSKFTDTKMRKKSMEQTPRQEADSFSTAKHTVRLLGNWEVYYCFHRSPNLILSHLNPMCIITHLFKKSNLTNPSNLHPGLSSILSSPSQLNFVGIFISTMHVTRRNTQCLSCK